MEEIIKLKAEIFDLQIEMNGIKQRMSDKLKELNRVQGDNGKIDGRIPNGLLPKNEGERSINPIPDK